LTPPFLGMATAEGRSDASPKGAAPAVAEVLDDRTLLLPGRLGNSRLDEVRNILANPHAGLPFRRPGCQATSRVVGRARVSTEPVAPASTAHAGRLGRSASVLAVGEACRHGGKTLIRSPRWEPAQRIERCSFSAPARIISDQLAALDEAVTAARLDQSRRDRLC
jgi:predicted pyridoxine 5'-phosphate oxidase superfamily flavin-nucleotide-binding protein